MTTTTAAKRPAMVTFLAALIWVIAIFNVGLGVLMVLAPIGENPTVLSAPGGVSIEISTSYLLINGLLAIVLGLIYVTISKMILIGSRSAQVVIQALAVINIIFGFMTLPYGWVPIALNALALLIVSTSKANAWFRTAE
jgi:hypothetical protein